LSVGGGGGEIPRRVATSRDATRAAPTQRPRHIAIRWAAAITQTTATTAILLFITRTCCLQSALRRLRLCSV
jgi:hypothetical protein